MKWKQLIVGVLCLVTVSNLQYAWTLFVAPMQATHGWSRASIQVAFTIFIATQTWLVPFEGHIIDRFGPRLMVFGSGILIACAWVVNSYAQSLSVLYVGAVLGGVGTGVVLGACYGNVVKWFGDRRGLATGLTAAGYGAGSALTIVPIAWMIRTAGHESTFFTFGLIQGGAVLALAFFLRAPQAGEEERQTKLQSSTDRTPLQVLGSPMFWLMYAMFVLACSVGLVFIANLGPLAKDLGVADVPVALFGITLPALTFALSVDRVTNGLSRPFFGFVSDSIGREITLFIAFILEAFSILMLIKHAHDPVLFVLFTGLVFFAWGEIFSLFPALCTDLYGRKNAAANYGLLYTAKGTAALLVPLSSLAVAGGGWYVLFLIAFAFDVVAAFLAILVLYLRTLTSARAGG